MRGTERYSGLLSASRAQGLGLDLGVAIGLSGGGRSAEYGDALGFASFAALGFVLELFIVKEQLFAGGENKVGSAVDTLEYLVLEFH